MMKRPAVLTLALLAACFTCPSAEAAPAKPLWKSPVMRKGSLKIDVDVTGAKQLFLVVTDGGNGFSHDWAAWVEPTLVGSSGKVKLTDMKWKSASSGFGAVGINKNCAGKPISVSGKICENGIGTHANSVIVYDIAGKGFTRFQATAGMDDGGVGRDPIASIQFAVYTQAPPVAVVVAKRAAKPGGKRGRSHDPKDAVAALDVAAGLEATLFSSEPAIQIGRASCRERV